jgi:hypothetical protein
MIDDTANRLLMSEELRGNVPELEDDQIAALEDAFVIAALELRRGDEVLPVVGSLIGFSHEGSVKIDLSVQNSVAYSVVSEIVSGVEYTCDAYTLIFADAETRVANNFKVTSVRMMDFDRKSKMCTLAIDLDRAT